jgi:hypothetical protein
MSKNKEITMKQNRAFSSIIIEMVKKWS